MLRLWRCTSGLMHLVFVATCLGACVLSCGSKDGPTTSPGPRQFAVSVYSFPTTHPSGTFYFFNHQPLRRINRDPAGYYSYEYCDSTAGFWRMLSDGSGLTRILPYELLAPDWNPAGNALAVEKNKNIWVVPATADSIDAGMAVQITSAHESLSPQWSPDGSLIAYGVNIGANAGIHVIPAGGGVSRRIGTFLGLDPDWSPDGSHFAFYGQMGGQWGIGVCDTSGANAQMIVAKANARFSLPRWSPDGSKIAFTARMTNTDRVQLYCISPDGTGLKQLTTTGVLQEFSWSQNGQEIVFVRFDPLTFDYVNGTLWAINVDSGGLRQITVNPSCSP
jgi:Tol biopolymer transport system component